MATTKSTTLTLRIDPAIKEGLRLMSEKEHRSMTNMIEVLVRAYCQQNGIPLLEDVPLDPELDNYDKD